MKSVAGCDCAVVVLETSWRWKVSSTAISGRIHERAGPALHEQARTLYPNPAVLGEAYPVPVPASSPLFTEEGVHHVIYTVPPNMNPLRAHCISQTELGTAIKALRATWAAVFRAAGGISGRSTSILPAPTARNAFATLMSAARNGNGSTAPPGPARPTGHWNDALRMYCLHPDQHADVVVEYDDEIVVVRDKFPKAKHHLLIIPRKPIDGISNLGPGDVGLLDGLKKKADEIVAGISREVGGMDVECRVGFHAVPSMKQLHLHVISQDFDSPHLKNKKHWNSFTTPFFKDFEEVRDILNREGSVNFDTAYYEGLLKGPLKCHRCGEEVKNIPGLKAHIGGCGGVE
ncbi:HIT-like domain-containing protein [Fimicolochytrium jonesii]|uniref:HIT-like domain-containing protein n=1 Tax=Fimicolochytrium jonesii TaxID=1396493 RepID=UPI0022FE9E5F|nr:HIT-like domain-containing protein [Fimicolochytrium jonesii]KAI8822377.1 HIT-like domain-containing protein [Fimicolochytrium jonesii]